jgi:asparagine synthetase B (glutamine-hydrolysing)
LESRVPFLDTRLVELLAEVSPAVKMRGLTRKSILRGTIGRQLPRPLLSASKRGFNPPMSVLAKDSEDGWSEVLRPLQRSGLFASGALAGFGATTPSSSRPPTGVWALSMLAAQLGMSTQQAAPRLCEVRA